MFIGIFNIARISSLIISTEKKMRRRIMKENLVNETQLVAFKRYDGMYKEMGPYFCEIYEAYGDICSGAPFTLYFECSEDKGVYEVCLPIAKDEKRSDYETKEFNFNGKVVASEHKGSYETIGKTWQAVADYIKDKGYDFDVPSKETYLVGPGCEGKTEKDWLTKIEILVK